MPRNTIVDTTPYTLTCRQPPLSGLKTAVEPPFQRKARRVRSRKQRFGGFWELTWWFPFDPALGITSSMLTDWFDNRLALRIDQEVGGAIAFQGIVWDMKLMLHGSAYRRSLDELWNAVKVKFREEDGTPNETAWQENEASIKRYGRREFIIPLNKVSATQALNEAKTTLVQTADPWPQPLRFGSDPREEGLLVTAMGDVATANNKYVSTTTLDGNTGNASDFISMIVENDCEYLSAGRIQENTMQVTREFDTPVRALDAIRHITLQGDGTQPWLFWVDVGGHANYGPASNEPRYQWRGISMWMRDLLGDRSPWTLWPAVLRDMTRPAGKPVPGSFLQQSNDSWINEVEMADELSEPQLKPEDDEEEILRLSKMHQSWFEAEGQHEPQAEAISR